MAPAAMNSSPVPAATSLPPLPASTPSRAPQERAVPSTPSRAPPRRATAPTRRRRPSNQRRCPTTPRRRRISLALLPSPDSRTAFAVRSVERVRGRVRGAACYRSQGAGHRAAPTLPSVDICARALQRPRGWAELVLALCWPGQRAWQPDDRMWLHERLVRQSACPTVRLAVLPRGLLVPQPDCVSARLGLCVTRLPRCFREPVFLRTGSMLEIHTDETPVHSHSRSTQMCISNGV